MVHLLLRAPSPKVKPTNSKTRSKATPPVYQLWLRLRASSGVLPRGMGLGLMVRLRPGRLRLTTTTVNPRLLAATAVLRLMPPRQSVPLRRPSTVVTHHLTHHHLPSRHRSQVLPQASQVGLAMDRVALHHPSQVLPLVSQAVAMERLALHRPSQARRHLSLAVAMGLPKVRLVVTGLHRDLHLLMEVSLTVLVDLVVLFLLVHLFSGFQARSPMAHYLARLVRLRSRMVVVGGKV